MLKKFLPWLCGIALMITMTGYFTYRMKSPNQAVFLPGTTTHGHYQIELSCNACHTPMMGVKEETCYDCHGQDLKEANDSHPKSKFTDPRNADRVAKLDARNCITCHIEHRSEQTNAMGLTIPTDYCFYCHDDIGVERPSHLGYEFTTCLTAGCHNYHDNTALYESFLSEHLHEPVNKPRAEVLERQLAAFLKDVKSVPRKAPLTVEQQDAPASNFESELLRDWLETSHAIAGINCADCHQQSSNDELGEWSDSLTHTACATCHEREVNGFLAGKHGMRLAQDLPPMTPAMARLPMKLESFHSELSCASCHSSHRFDTQTAAVDSCLNCHNDQHSLAYTDSPHFDLWLEELASPGTANTGVSCATCHLPRVTENIGGSEWVRVEHDQNWNLEPNEKMIRSVCMQCHGLGFSIDALADTALIRNNFRGQPSVHVESLELVEKRLLEIEQRNQTN